MREKNYQGFARTVCIGILLLIVGCSLPHAIKQDGRFVRANQYSVGEPSGKWSIAIRDNSYRLTDFFANEQAIFLHCPDHQVLTLADIYVKPPPHYRYMKKYLPAEVDPDSFEGRALAYLEMDYIVTHRSVPTSHHTLISFSTNTTSQIKILDAVYKDETIAMPSCVSSPTNRDPV